MPMQHFLQEETGYQRIQGTKPQTLGYGLNDSPAGLAAWIVEKFRAWSDCDGDVERRFTKDELLTNVMLYWVPETATSSARLYYEMLHAGKFPPQGFRVNVPTGCAIFPREIMSRPAPGSTASIRLPSGRASSRAATSPPWRSPPRWSTTSAASSGRYEPDAHTTRRSAPAQLDGLLEHPGGACVADGGLHDHRDRHPVRVPQQRAAAPVELQPQCPVAVVLDAEPRLA